MTYIATRLGDIIKLADLKDFRIKPASASEIEGAQFIVEGCTFNSLEDKIFLLTEEGLYRVIPLYSLQLAAVFNDSILKNMLANDIDGNDPAQLKAYIQEVYAQLTAVGMCNPDMYADLLGYSE